MNQAFSLTLSAVALAAGAACATTEAQEKETPKVETVAAQDGMDPAMMQKMMELAIPGPAHQEFAARAGTWNQHYKMRMSPDAPWTEFEGTCETKVVLDGRYLLEEVKFDMMGMPMQGMFILGFDNMSQEYIAWWADSMSTWWVTSRGKKDASGAIDLKGTMVDIAGTRPFRMVIRYKDADTTESEMYDTIPPKGEVQVMSFTSTRKK